MTPLGRGSGRERSAAEREAARQERARRRAEREAAAAAFGREPEELDGEDLGTEAVDPAVAAFGLDPEEKQRSEHDSLGDDDLLWSRADEPTASPRRSTDAPSASSAVPSDEPTASPVPSDEPTEASWTPPDEPTAARSVDPQATVPFRLDIDDELAPRPPGAALGEGTTPAGEQPRRTVSLPRASTQRERPDTETAASWDAPVGTVRTSQQGYTPGPGAPGVPPHRTFAVRRGRRRPWRSLALLFVLGVLAAAAVFALKLYQPFHGDPGDPITITIPQGATAREIGDLLAERGIVDSGFFFALRARLSGQREDLRAGEHTLRRKMSYADALVVLTTPPRAAPVMKITLPEGPSRRELVERVEEAGVRGDYLKASRASSLLRPSDYGAPKGATLEGFLFPATYEMRRSDADAEKLVDLQVAAFKQNFAQIDLTRAKSANLTRYDVIIIASMIEREAGVERDRRLISAVIWNRLKKRMPLGIDATIRFRVNNWTRPLRQSELAVDSAYNTRTHLGLPPGPIGNPGLASLKAAANPAKVDYLYYVVKPCGNGAHAFSSTEAQFQRDVQAYNRARERNGGNDPSRC